MSYYHFIKTADKDDFCNKYNYLFLLLLFCSELKMSGPCVSCQDYSPKCLCIGTKGIRWVDFYYLQASHKSSEQGPAWSWSQFFCGLWKRRPNLVFDSVGLNPLDIKLFLLVWAGLWLLDVPPHFVGVKKLSRGCFCWFCLWFDCFFPSLLCFWSGAGGWRFIHLHLIVFPMIFP